MAALVTWLAVCGFFTVAWFASAAAAGPDTEECFGPCPVDDLSSDELLARLDARSVPANLAEALLDGRDDPQDHDLIHRILDGRQP